MFQLPQLPQTQKQNGFAPTKTPESYAYILRGLLRYPCSNELHNLLSDIFRAADDADWGSLRERAAEVFSPCGQELYKDPISSALAAFAFGVASAENARQTYPPQTANKGYRHYMQLAYAALGFAIEAQ